MGWTTPALRRKNLAMSGSAILRNMHTRTPRPKPSPSTLHWTPGRRVIAAELVTMVLSEYTLLILLARNCFFLPLINQTVCIYTSELAPGFPNQNSTANGVCGVVRRRVRVYMPSRFRVTLTIKHLVGFVRHTDHTWPTCRPADGTHVPKIPRVVTPSRLLPWTPTYPISAGHCPECEKRCRTLSADCPINTNTSPAGLFRHPGPRTPRQATVPSSTRVTLIVKLKATRFSPSPWTESPCSRCLICRLLFIEHILRFNTYNTALLDIF